MVTEIQLFEYTNRTALKSRRFCNKRPHGAANHNTITVELQFSRLIGTVSHPDMCKKSG